LKDAIALQFLWTVAAVFGAGAVLIQFAWRPEKSPGSRLWAIWGFEILILAAIFVPAYLGGLWLLGAVLILAMVSGSELFSTLEKASRRPHRAAGLALGALGIWGIYAWPGLSPYIFIPLLVLAVVLRRRRRLPSEGGSSTDPRLSRGYDTLVGVLYPSLCLAHLVEIAGMPGGFGMVVFYYGVIETSDSFAFLVGGALGKRKIWPRLSPRKTVEGTLAGAAAGLCIAYVLRFAVPGFSTPQLLGAVALIMVGGLAGDLFASSIKRSAGTRNFSGLIPNHGGLLDVYDSLVLGSPLFYYYLRLNGFG
jgi:phosphatidate cytidylyltransferase